MLADLPAAPAALPSLLDEEDRMSLQNPPTPLGEHDGKPAVRAGLDRTPLYKQQERPFRRTARGVQFDESKMEINRPYPFKLPDSGVWLIAVRRSTAEGDVRLYQLA